MLALILGDRIDPLISQIDRSAPFPVEKPSVRFEPARLTTVRQIPVGNDDVGPHASRGQRPLFHEVSIPRDEDGPGSPTPL